MSRIAASYLPEAHAASIEVDSLWDFVPAVSPSFSAPRHLHEIAEAFDDAMAAARGEGPPVFVCTSIPPQHAKTETYLHGAARWLKEQPADFLAYLSYNQDIADDKSAKVRMYAEIAGVDIRQDTRSKKLWRTTASGGLMAGGIVGGSVTGREALKCLIVDDPYRNRADAESRVIRDKVWAEFSSSIWTRLHAGTSVFVNHTRWHADDLIGRIKKDPELSKLFRFINYPVVTRGGDPAHTDDFDVLWPEVQTKELIKRKRMGSTEYEWWSLYMGEPRPRDTQLFQDVSFYTEMPSTRQYAIGVDLSYSGKTSSDWSVAVVMARSADQFYVVEVVRKQCRPEVFARDLLRLKRDYPGAPMRIYGTGPELGTVSLFQRDGIPLQAVPCGNADKYTRATPWSVAWNQGRAHVPQEVTAWREPYVACHLDFSGINDPQDDDVDASAAAYDQLVEGTGAGIYTPQETAKPRRRAPRSGVRGRRGSAW